MIGGFIITGSEPKKVILRGLGPSFTTPFSNVIPDPVLQVFNSAGAVMFSNDNWKDTQRAEIEATPVAPRNDLESAIVATLSPGTYTAALSEKNNVSGVGLFEVYDLSLNAASRLANISTRGPVRTDTNVMIAGFILGGNSVRSADIVVRALGPSLATAGVTNVLVDPVLQLFDGNGQLFAENDNWQDAPQDAAIVRQLGIAPPDNAEAAVVFQAPPGAYTAVVLGQARDTGIGLVEVYHVQ